MLESIRTQLTLVHSNFRDYFGEVFHKTKKNNDCHNNSRAVKGRQQEFFEFWLFLLKNCGLQETFSNSHLAIK